MITKTTQWQFYGSFWFVWNSLLDLIVSGSVLYWQAESALEEDYTIALVELWTRRFASVMKMRSKRKYNIWNAEKQKEEQI